MSEDVRPRRGLRTVAAGARLLAQRRRTAAVAPLILAAHGSRDPASARTMVAVAERVDRLRPGPVMAAFLDFNQPSIADAVVALSAGSSGDPAGTQGGGPVPVVVPALLTDAFHGRVDLPDVLAGLDVPTEVAPVLGPDPLLLKALRRRLSELDIRVGGFAGFDGLVLIAAGTANAAARSTVDGVAAELGRSYGVTCMAGYASSSGPTVAEAVALVGATGASRIVVASYFLAPGRLYDAAARSATDAGALAVAVPIGEADELVRLVVARAESAVPATRSMRVAQVVA